MATAAEARKWTLKLGKEVGLEPDKFLRFVQNTNFDYYVRPAYSVFTTAEAADETADETADYKDYRPVAIAIVTAFINANMYTEQSNNHAFMNNFLDPKRDYTCRGIPARFNYKDQLMCAGFTDAMATEIADWLVDECVQPWQRTLKCWVLKHVEDSCVLALPMPNTKRPTAADLEERACYPPWRPSDKSTGAAPWYSATFQLEAMRIQLYGWNHVKRHSATHIHLCKIKNKAVQLGIQSVKAARQPKRMYVELYLPNQLGMHGFLKDIDFVHMRDGSLVIKSRRCANYIMNCCVNEQPHNPTTDF